MQHKRSVYELNKHLERNHSPQSNSGVCEKDLNEMSECDNLPLNHDKKDNNHSKDDKFCILCTTAFQNEIDLEWHMETEHEVGNYKCLACNFCSESQDELGIHIVSLHAFPCDKCQSTIFQTPELLASHNVSHHQSQPCRCEKCGETFYNRDTMNEHMRQHYEIGQDTNCGQCDYKGKSVNDFITHLLKTHKKNPEMIECEHCEYRSISVQNYNEHLQTDHEEFTILGNLVSNQNGLNNNFETFKTELTDILNTIIQDSNVVKQELFILRQ